MGLSSNDPFETLSAESLRRLVGDLLCRLQSLEDQVMQLGDQLASAEVARTALQVENQELRDEIARLKNLPPRPPFKPSGMDKITEREVRKSGSPRRRRGLTCDTNPRHPRGGADRGGPFGIALQGISSHPGS